MEINSKHFRDVFSLFLSCVDVHSERILTAIGKVLQNKRSIDDDVKIYEIEEMLLSMNNDLIRGRKFPTYL
jgi:hypothetical protein